MNNLPQDNILPDYNGTWDSSVENNTGPTFIEILENGTVKHVQPLVACPYHPPTPIIQEIPESWIEDIVYGKKIMHREPGKYVAFLPPGYIIPDGYTVTLTLRSTSKGPVAYAELNKIEDCAHNR
jgi:hypothetical protein